MVMILMQNEGQIHTRAISVITLVSFAKCCDFPNRFYKKISKIWWISLVQLGEQVKPNAKP